MKKIVYIWCCLAVLLFASCEPNVPMYRTQRGSDIENRWYLCARSMMSEFVAEMFDVNALLYADSLTRVQVARQFVDYAVFESVGDTLFVLQRYAGLMPHVIVVDNHQLTDEGAAWTLILNADKNLNIGDRKAYKYPDPYYETGIGHVEANTVVEMKCTAGNVWTVATPVFEDGNENFAMQWVLERRKNILVQGIYTLDYELSGKGVFVLEQNVALAHEIEGLIMCSLSSPDRFEAGAVHIVAQQLGTGETHEVAVAYNGSSKEITYRGVTETYY